MPDMPPLYATLWRQTLPVAAILAVVAILGGLLSTGGWPAIVFGVALVFAAAGIASLVAFLILRARRAVSDGASEIAEKFEDFTQGDDPPKPGQPRERT
jgi:flagellar motor component MotA